MNDEIKEIFDRIETASEIFDCLLKPEECTELLDYITKLQQENERLKETNKELKDSSPLDEAFYNGVHKLYEDYKSRCEKAIEYIKEHIKYECDNAFNGMQFYSYHLYDFKKEVLLNILQNGSEEK